MSRCGGIFVFFILTQQLNHNEKPIMAKAPKKLADKTDKMITAWQEHAPAATFAGMTLAQYQTKVQPSVDVRTQIAATRRKLKDLQADRQTADTVTNPVNLLVVDAVKGDVNFGEDSDLYEGMGYVRKSARASGLTRKKTAAPATAK
jgi:hypothetical protein